MRSIFNNIVDILWLIMYSPVLLLEFFEEMISEDFKYGEGDDKITKRLLIFGGICLSLGITIGLIIGSLCL